MPVVLQRSPDASRATLQDLLERSRLDTILIVVPTKRRIRHLTREVLQLVRKGVSPALPIHTLESLAVSILMASVHSRRLVSTPAQTLLFDRAIHATQSMLGYFTWRGGERRMFQGTFERVLDVITVLKESGVSPDLLEEEASGAPLEDRQKLTDVAALYRAYEAQLESAGMTDLGGIYRFFHGECTQAEFEQLFRRVYPEVVKLSLSGFDEFTPLEMGLLSKLSSVRDISVSLLFDFQHGNRGLFGHLEANYERFRSLGFVEVRRREPNSDTLLSVSPRARPAPTEGSISHLTATLFNPQRPADKADLTRHVTVICAKNRVAEIESVCKIIKQRVADRPETDLSTVCLAMVRPQRYTDIVREQFKRFSIPVNVTDRFELRRSPLATVLLGVLQIPTNGYRRDDVLRLLPSRYLMFADSTDRSNLAEVTRLLRITGGTRMWRERIPARIRHLEEQRSGSGRYGAYQDAERELQACRRARDDFELIYRLTRPLLGNRTPSEFVETFEAVLQSLEVPARLLRRGGIEQERTERDVRAYAKFIDVLHETADLLAFQEGRSATHSLRHYTETLRLALSRERFNVREEFGKGVLVTSIDETRGLSMDIMFIAGLVDGEFPSVYDPEVFLSTTRRKARERRHNWQERYLFYQAMTNWSEHLYVTYPERDGDLNLVRSPFVDELLTVADVTRLIPVRAFPVCDVLCAEDEVLRWHARHRPVQEDVEQTYPSALRSKLSEMRRVVAIEETRAGGRADSEYEGLVWGALSHSARERLEAWRRATYSVSQLETYSQCPFRFFAERILSLSLARDFREDLTELERGSLVHQILFEFFLSRREGGSPALARCTDAEFEEARTALLRLAEEKLAALQIPDPFWDIDREAILGMPGGRKGYLQEFLEMERARNLESEPKYFEVSFGGDPGEFRDPVLQQSEPLVMGNLRLRGKVDRIDVGGEHFTILDYKTGRHLPGYEEIHDGLSLQIPLYLRAVETLLGSTGQSGLEPAAGLYVQLRRPVRTRVVVANAEFKRRAYDSGRSGPGVLENADALRDLMDHSQTLAEQCVDGIAAGRFPLTTADRIGRVCTFCEYKAMCRIQRVRRVRSRERETP